MRLKTKYNSIMSKAKEGDGLSNLRAIIGQAIEAKIGPELGAEMRPFTRSAFKSNRELKLKKVNWSKL